jgi:hypothetical protein
MKSGRDSGSRFAGMVMVGFVLAAALTLGVALAPVGAYHEEIRRDSEEDGTPDVDSEPTPDMDHLGVEDLAPN